MCPKGFEKSMGSQMILNVAIHFVKSIHMHILNIHFIGILNHKIFNQYKIMIKLSIILLFYLSKITKCNLII